MGACAVIDIGKTHQKVLTIDGAGRCLSSERVAIAPLAGPPYPHLDAEAVWSFVLRALARLARDVAVDALVVSAYGSTAALVDDTGLVLPIADYEHEPPADLVAGYAAAAPPFAEAFAPTNPAGLTLGRQLYWLARAYPEAVARTRHLLLHPQYWAWRLSGVAAAEITSLGAQTHLWAPLAGRLTDLAVAEGWADRLPPIRRAWDALGPITPQVAAITGLPADTPVLCGIHDSNANYLRYRQGLAQPVTVMSTGTWLITFNPTGRPADLDPNRDTNTNTDAFGDPVCCSRFMLGREHALAGGTRQALTPADIAGVVSAGAMALPSFTDTGGPVPATGGQGRMVGPAIDDPRWVAARATLYAALMSAEALRAGSAQPPIVIDGGFADAPLYAALIAALWPDGTVHVSTEPDGTAIGASLLWDWGRRTVPQPLLRRVSPLGVTGLDAYAARWRDLVRVRR